MAGGASGMGHGHQAVIDERPQMVAVAQTH
jgi:hypothetical protein